jgi:predicted metalloprotease with PDZ domain
MNRMTHYHISITHSHQQFIKFRVLFSGLPENASIHLPVWRPGRYELGNFAKNVRKFSVNDSDGAAIPFEKTALSTWVLKNKAHQVVEVSYEYFAAELNAGSSYLNADQLYVNPVNCFVYCDQNSDREHLVSLDIPEDWIIATSLKQERRVLKAADFHELADSPFICAKHLVHGEYTVQNTKFHLWFNGYQHVPWDKLIKDFRAFTTSQMDKFGSFPVDEYHFLFQIVPYKAYHGVEHLQSTVIALGPTYDIFDSLYTELLGVSSHELYHTWNVKTIRPIEMFPYDYQKENLSRLGYLCEGVTTYMGDLFLLKSGVFSLEQYLKELSVQFQKHFDNPGRLNYSVASSSFDTWLDGYTPGVPGRKVSIYTEGCLLALATDILLLKQTSGSSSLDSVMRKLYEEVAHRGKGVDEGTYWSYLLELGGVEVTQLKDLYFHGTRDFTSLMERVLDLVGLKLDVVPSSRISASYLGIKFLPNGVNALVKNILPQSLADLSGLMLEDEIIAINKILIGGELDKWLTYFKGDKTTLTVQRAGKLVEIELMIGEATSGYNEYKVKKLGQLSEEQTLLFEKWTS